MGNQWVLTVNERAHSEARGRNSGPPITRDGGAFPTLVQELRAARRWHLMGICSQEAGRGCSRQPPRLGDPCSRAGLGGPWGGWLSPLEGHRTHVGLHTLVLPGLLQGKIKPTASVPPAVLSSPSCSTPVPPDPSGTASLLQPPTHPPTRAPSTRGLAGRPAGSLNPGRPELGVSLRGRRQPGGPAHPACLAQPSQDSCGKPPFLHSCRWAQPRPSWPGEGSQLRPAEDRRAIFSGNKWREIAPTGEQPLVSG